MLHGIKGSRKTNIPSSKYWWPWNSPVATLCQIYDKIQFHMVKGIDNAFDHMELCFISRRIIAVKIGMFFQEITSTTEFPGSDILLPTIETGSKWGFQVANLLLATVNFEPCLGKGHVIQGSNQTITKVISLCENGGKMFFGFFLFVFF